MIVDPTPTSLRPTGLVGTIRTAVRRLGRLATCRRGNVSMLFGFAVIPLTFATGMAIDYTRAMQLRTRLTAAADAAALAAVSRANIDIDTADAQVVAHNLFVAQSQSAVDEGRLTLDFNATHDLTITVHDDTSAVVKVRTATVAFNGQSNNIFAGILGLDTLTVKGTSVAKASDAPDIDFYVMMDTSPSMLLPATSAGLQTMISNTSDHCAFACHLTNGNDYYTIARNHNLVLRTDLVTKAVEDLTVTAANVATNNNTTYRMGLFDFDYMFRKIWPLNVPNGQPWVAQSLSSVKNHVSDSVPLTYCKNNYRLCNTLDNDTATNFTTAMTSMNATMVDPGSGTGEDGDTPQAVLFIITDGMRDEMYNGSRIMGPLPASLCDTIKNRNIRIAILETEYLPESASDSWSITNVKDKYLAPTNTISPALEACATSGLYYQVTTDSDVSAALSALFQAVVSSAHLTQ